MRIGLVARANNKGLGTMTWEFYRHMRPARTLVVRWPADEDGWQTRYPDGRLVEWDGSALPQEAIDWLLDGCDVLYTAETPYDYRLFERARERGVGTVLHGMWEFLAYRPRQPVRPPRQRASRTRSNVDLWPPGRLPRPDLFCAPSPWHLREWPTPTELLPVPFAGDRLRQRSARRIRRIVHPAGSPAAGDRNGTQAVLRAAQLMHSQVELVVRSMAELQPPQLRNGVRLAIAQPTPDYWRVLEEADAVVLPRRYGGLCLPLQEASALGLPIVALHREIVAGYPHAAVVRTIVNRPMRLPCGKVERYDVDPRQLAKALDQLVADEAMAERLAAGSRGWAEKHSWEALQPRYEALLASVAR